jgi:hypothetical protein
MIIVFRFLCRSVSRPIQETGSYPARRRMTVSFQTQHRRVAGGKINSLIANESAASQAVTSTASISVASSASAFELLTRFDTGQHCR